MKAILNRLLSVFMKSVKPFTRFTRSLFNRFVQSIYTWIDRILPQHLSVAVLYQLNQILGFIIFPLIYLLSKLICMVYPLPINLTLVGVFLVYVWILVDQRAPFLFFQWNVWVLNRRETQIWLHESLWFEDFLTMFKHWGRWVMLIGLGFVLIFINGDLYASTLAYSVLWVVSLYVRIRFKYLNQVQLELICKEDHPIPNWELLIAHLNSRLALELREFKSKLKEAPTHLYSVRNAIGRNQQPYLFLASRSFASNPEIQKLAVEAFKVAAKNNGDTVSLTLSLVTLGVAVTGLVFSQYLNYHQETKKLQIEEKKVELKHQIDQKKLQLEQIKVDIAQEDLKLRRLVQALFEKAGKEEHEQLKAKQIVSDTVGPYITRKQRSELDQQDLKKLADILSKTKDD